MNRKLTLGSLFDGIGGFPLAGKMAGITSIWASEIEPFPIRVTEKRLPEMKHYGDVHGLNGANLGTGGYYHFRLALSGSFHRGKAFRAGRQSFGTFLRSRARHC